MSALVILFIIICFLRRFIQESLEPEFSLSFFVSKNDLFIKTMLLQRTL